MILAEGLGQDAKGAITLISVNQNLLIAPSLPAITRRAVFAHFVVAEGDLKSGDQMDFKVSAISPAGEVISAQQGQGTVGDPMWPELPLTLDFPVQLALNCKEYGEYRIQLDVQFPHESFREAVSFFVKPPPEGVGGTSSKP